jgi:hypothetical protein
MRFIATDDLPVLSIISLAGAGLRVQLLVWCSDSASAKLSMRMFRCDAPASMQPRSNPNGLKSCIMSGLRCLRDVRNGSDLIKSDLCAQHRTDDHSVDQSRSYMSELVELELYLV